MDAHLASLLVRFAAWPRVYGDRDFPSVAMGHPLRRVFERARADASRGPEQ